MHSDLPIEWITRALELLADIDFGRDCANVQAAQRIGAARGYLRAAVRVMREREKGKG